MKKLSVLPGLCSGSTMASLTLHGGLIALALLLGGQASLPQEKVYRVSLAQMTASVQPAAPGLPDGGAAAPARAITPQEVIKSQEKQQPQPLNTRAQASEKMVSPVKKKNSASKSPQEAVQRAVQRAESVKPVKTAAAVQTPQQTAAEAPSGTGAEAQARGLADGKGAAGHGKNGAESGGAASPGVLHKLLGAIEQYKNYPKHARRTGAEGTAILLVQVGNDGKVTGSSLHRGSGHGVLDSATEQLGTRLAGLDTGVRGSSFSVRVPVEYSLH
ncbi:energy transducer TonB [Desulfovibrio sp. UIB00]|uniref:TonB family protein n=1 Tax=Desulfovibrio sp. UIB00 TaxID=2804314 RepID=UPI001F0EE4CE|nr:TonB family protein [Desulfovibrio sp. UIB00]MCH5146276.1 energy transducer TonB [Desulfovibrio sp. UIB00]